MIVTVNGHGLRWGEIYYFFLHDKTKSTDDIYIYYSHLNEKKNRKMIGYIFLII